MNEPAIIGGIDPGVGGAIALLRPDYSCVQLVDMPTEEKRNGKRQVEPLRLFNLLNSPEHFLYVLVESVSARPGQGVSSMFSLGDSFGCARAAAAAAGTVNYVHPATWKKAMKVTENKAYSLTLARRFYPDLAETMLARKKDEGRAEALLLARFAVEHFSKYF